MPGRGLCGGRRHIVVRSSPSAAPPPPMSLHNAQVPVERPLQPLCDTVSHNPVPADTVSRKWTKPETTITPVQPNAAPPLNL